MRKRTESYGLNCDLNDFERRNDFDWSAWNPTDGYGLDEDGNYPEVL